MTSREMGQLKNCISLVELVENDPRYRDLKQHLSSYDKNSKAYLIAFLDAMPLTKHVDYHWFLRNQAVAVPGSQIQGFSPVYRSGLSPDYLISTIHPQLATFFELFNFSVDRFPNNDCLGERVRNASTGEWSDHYVFESYKQIQERSRNLGSGIMTVVNLKRKQKFHVNDFVVSLLSSNRKEWVIADLACQAYSLPNTALYETLGLETSEYILNTTASPVLILSKDNVYKVLEMLPGLPYLSTLICMDELTTSELSQLNGSLLPRRTNKDGDRISILTLREVERIGASNKVPLIPPTPDSLYTISFTSGTTGVPKGCLLYTSRCV